MQYLSPIARAPLGIGAPASRHGSFQITHRRAGPEAGVPIAARQISRFRLAAAGELPQAFGDA
jgi:hypothetical protein